MPNKLFVGSTMGGFVLLLLILAVLHREEERMVDVLTSPEPIILRTTSKTSKSTATSSPNSRTSLGSTPINSILYHSSSRQVPAISPAQFASKQDMLTALTMGEFTPRGLNKTEYTADHFSPNTALARQVYSKWSSLERTKECIRNKRIFLTGTSFQRSILWSLLRRLMDDAKDIPSEYRLIASVPSLIREKDSLTGKCDNRVGSDTYHVQEVPWKTQVPSCFLVKNKECEHPGPAGINLAQCGLPMSAKWRPKDDEDDTTVFYQFKTYISAPAVDARIMAMLKQQSKPWDVVWVESGEWGSWGTPHERERTTFQESYDFLRKVLYSHKGWVVVSGNSGYTEQNRLFLSAARALVERHGERLFVFDQKPIVEAGRARDIPEGHGYYGTMTDVMVRVFFALVCDEAW